jgi:hypothetical protein
VTKPAEVNRYYLHNQIGHSANTSSVALLGMPFTTTAPNTNVLNDFSTDDGKGSNVPGRNLVYNSSLPSITAASASTVAQWKVKVTSGNAPVLNGNVIVEVWAQNDPTVSPKNGTLALRAMVGYQAKNNVAIVELDSTAGGKVVSDTGCSGWRKYVISVPINSQTLAKNSTVVLDIFNANPSNALRLAYDTTTYPADVYWPFTSGSFSG